MSCAKLLITQAYIDDELDAAAALAAEQHIEDCIECALLRDGALSIRKALQQEATYHNAPEEFRFAISKKISNATGKSATGIRNWLSFIQRPLPFLTGMGIGTVATLAASLMIWTIITPAENGIANDIISAHLRSLVGTHLTDVMASDRHTVRPWFRGHSDVSPPVGNFPEAGFTLVGGRVDYVNDRRAAVIIYRHGAHVVNVFTWKDLGDAKPGIYRRNGYLLLSWKQHDLFFCAVSDTDPQALRQLAHLIQGMDQAPE